MVTARTCVDDAGPGWGRPGTRWRDDRAGSLHGRGTSRTMTDRARSGRLAYRRPSTVSSASSIPHCSSELRCPARSPSRVASTAPSCSTSTRVRLPAISISGRKEAGRAERDVGATSTTDRGRNSVAWTTTPNRSPCCSCPTPLGRLNRNTSPRSTQRLHKFGHGRHLGAIGVIGFELGDFGCKFRSPPEPTSRIDESRTDRF